MNSMARLTVVAVALAAAACATRSPVHTPGADVTTPVVVTDTRPVYTEDAMAAKLQGSVLLDCVVLPDGTVGDVEVVRSLDAVYGLDAQAVLAAKQWTFEPGLKDGVPVPVRVAVEMSFTLK